MSKSRRNNRRNNRRRTNRRRRRRGGKLTRGAKAVLTAAALGIPAGLLAYELERKRPTHHRRRRRKKRGGGCPLKQQGGRSRRRRNNRRSNRRRNNRRSNRRNNRRRHQQGGGQLAQWMYPLIPNDILDVGFSSTNGLKNMYAGYVGQRNVPSSNPMVQPIGKDVKVIGSTPQSDMAAVFSK